MDTESRQESTVGQAVNLMSSDTGDICHALGWMVGEIVCVPIKLVLCLVLLYTVLGPSMLLSEWTMTTRMKTIMTIIMMMIAMMG